MGYILYDHGGSGDHGSEDRIRGTCRLLPCRPALVTGDPSAAYGYGLADVADLTCRAAPSAADTTLSLFPQQGRWVLWCWPGGPLPQRGKPAAAVVSCACTYQAMQPFFPGKLVLGPDPLFLVDRQIRPLRGCFRRDTVGLCFSSVSRSWEARDGLLYAAYRRLIQTLLELTNFDIALIPYCCKRRRNDQLLLRALYTQFQHTGRLFLRPDGPSPALRGDLSLCRFVIGSAGAMAAWSCGVPALCIGADPEAMALAADLFGDWQDGVLPVGWIRSEDDLLRAVIAFFRREDSLRRIMATTVAHRRQRSLAWEWSCIE